MYLSLPHDLAALADPFDENKLLALRLIMSLVSYRY